MLPANYNRVSYMDIPNMKEFLAVTTPKTAKTLSKVSSLHSKCVATFGDNNITGHVSLDNRYFKFNVMEKKMPIGVVFYVPSENRIDIWADGRPVIQTINKKILYRGYSDLLRILGLDQIFNKLVNIF